MKRDMFPAWLSTRHTMALVDGCSFPEEQVIVAEGTEPGDPPTFAVHEYGRLDPEIRALIEAASGGRQRGDVFVLPRNRAHLIVNARNLE